MDTATINSLILFGTCLFAIIANMVFFYFLLRWLWRWLRQ